MAAAVELKLRPYPHQVAGHDKEKLLSCHSGKFVLKPQVKAANFAREVEFYSTISTATASSDILRDFCPLRRFLPQFFGVLSIGRQNQTDIAERVPHIVLEDLTDGFALPSIIDLKIGRRTYEPTASPKKIEYELQKYPPQHSIGFRISGSQTFDVKTAEYRRRDKRYGQAQRELHDVTAALREFFFDGCSVRSDAIAAAIAQLQELLYAMELQRSFHFYCSSVLIIFDAQELTSAETWQNGGEEASEIQLSYATGAERDTLQRMEAYSSSGSSQSVRVKMVDFAHALPVDGATVGGNDESYNYGIRSLIDKLQSLLDTEATDR